MSAVNITSELLGFHYRFVQKEPPGSEITLLLLHGTGGSEHDLLGLGPMLLPEAALLSPRGKVLENGMSRFFRRLAEGVFDEADLHRRTDELADFIAAACEKHGRDASKVIAVGLSNGANIAASLLLQRPGVLGGAVLFRAMTPFEPQEAVNLLKTPVLMLSGTADSIVPRANAEHLAHLLQNAGANVTLHWQRAGHGLAETDIQVAHDWLTTFPAKG